MNPCNEIIINPRLRPTIYEMKFNPAEFAKEYPREFLGNNMTKQICLPAREVPHSKQSELQYGRSIRVDGNIDNVVETSDEQTIWQINMPGIPANEMEIRRVNDILRFTHIKAESFDMASGRNNRNRLEFQLDENETVNSINHQLGVVTIIIDRGTDIQDLEIGYGITN